jgi:hypothetical protein
MARHIFLAFTHPVPGREDDFIAWQKTVHMPEGLTIPGFTGATLYRLSAHQLLDGQPPQAGAFVTVWELESDDMETMRDTVAEYLARFHWSDAIDAERTRTLTYTLEAKGRRT